MGILGDIAKRDLSGKTKREDNINNLSFEDFHHYVLDHYEMKHNQSINLSNRYNDDALFIEIPVIEFRMKTITGKPSDRTSYISILFADDNEPFMSINNSIYSIRPDFETRMGNDFKYDKGSFATEVRPKNNKLDNRTRLEMMDKVIEALGDDCILKKRNI